MDFTNLKAGRGFINIHDVMFRIHRFTPDAGEAYVAERTANSSFARLSVSYKQYGLTLFRFYAGNRDLYLYICDMIAEAADKLGRQFRCDSWED